MRKPRFEPGSGELAGMRGDNDVAALAFYLEDPMSSKKLRRRAASTLAGFGVGGGRAGLFLTGPTDPAVIPHLAPLVEDDSDTRLRRSAVSGLSRTGDPAAIGPLLRALDSDDRLTRRYAIKGLGDLGARDAFHPLIGMLDDPYYVEEAAVALSKIGDWRALGPMRTALTLRWALPRRRRKRIELAISDLERRYKGESS